MSPKGKRRLEFKPQKPLKGKKVYLDLQGYRKRDSLVHQIKDLGGVSRSISTFIKTTHNTSENNPHSYEVTLAGTNEAQKEIWGSNGIRTHDLRDTGAMLYQLSYEASLEAGQVRVQFTCIPIITVWRVWCLIFIMYTSQLIILVQVIGDQTSGFSRTWVGGKHPHQTIRAHFPVLTHKLAILWWSFKPVLNGEFWKLVTLGYSMHDAITSWPFTLGVNQTICLYCHLSLYYNNNKFI